MVMSQKSLVGSVRSGGMPVRGRSMDFMPNVQARSVLGFMIASLYILVESREVKRCRRVVWSGGAGTS
eukprot:1146490-Pelagomonas_calceolata.AAC.13